MKIRSPLVGSLDICVQDDGIDECSHTEQQRPGNSIYDSGQQISDAFNNADF